MSSERQELNEVSPWWGEHVHRYNEVIKQLKGKEDILDIACGTGFGSNLLASKINGNVIGGDLSSETIELCKNFWNASNLSFQVMDGTQLKFEDNTFDVVVSFETIEHTTAFNEMITEFKRVIKKGGKLFISTPNRLINSPSGIVTNPYHTQEWYYKEFVELLEVHFDTYQLFGQKYTRYNNSSLAEKVENLLYMRGIRKIPIIIQDYIMNAFGQPSMYPTENDYDMVLDPSEILQCKTFFVRVEV
jgi:2-polyprenyl-3-methyl-5-hydroxy-6-metoxy-1,4-benzoquinol methylase